MSDQHRTSPVAPSRSGQAHNEPFAWWGPVWTTPEPRSVLDLVHDGTLTAELTALLWAFLARRASIVVAAGPSGAGKTTLLTALLALLPPDTRRIYLRGCYEPFAFLDDPTVEPRSTYLLVNEISAHLPTYLWGPGVGRTLAAVRAGFGLAATAHATTVEELVYGLAGYPLRVPAADIAAIDLVLLLDAWHEDDDVHRQVAHLASLSSTQDRGVRVDLLATRPSRTGNLTIDVAAAGACFAKLGGDVARLASEVKERTALLNELSRAAANELPTPDETAAVLAMCGVRWLAATNIE